VDANRELLGAQTQLVSLLVSGLTVVTAVALLRVRRLRRDSLVIALVAGVAVLALGVLQGLIVAVVISLGEFLVRSSRPSRSVLGRVPGTTAYVDHERTPRPAPNRGCSSTG
jgi:sulfate permease, SulP family